MDRSLIGTLTTFFAVELESFLFVTTPVARRFTGMVSFNKALLGPMVESL